MSPVGLTVLCSDNKFQIKFQMEIKSLANFSYIIYKITDISLEGL
jgi:hypothetical protein